MRSSSSSTRQPGKACTRPIRMRQLWAGDAEPRHLCQLARAPRALGFAKYLDAVSCHGYYIVGASSALPPEVGDLPEKVQALRTTMASVLPAGTKLFVTEVGIGYPMGANYGPNYPTSAVLTEHAEAVVRTHLINLGEGVDTSFIFYSSDFTSPVGFGTYFNLSLSNYASGNLEPKPTPWRLQRPPG